MSFIHILTRHKSVLQKNQDPHELPSSEKHLNYNLMLCHILRETYTLYFQHGTGRGGVVDFKVISFIWNSVVNVTSSLCLKLVSKATQTYEN